jgi:hypothetical protein
MSKPKVVDATREELDELLALAKAASFPPEKYQLLEAVLASFVYVMQMLQSTKSALLRFRKMVFGARTESKANVLKANIGGEAPTKQEPVAERPEASPGDHGMVAPLDRPSERAALEGKRGGTAEMGHRLIAAPPWFRWNIPV